MKNKNDNKDKKTNGKGRRNLSVSNLGDTVIIRNRSVIVAGLVGVIVLILSVAAAVYLREAWKLPIFWVILGALFLGTGYSVAQMIFGKIVLDSKENVMTVYSPFSKSYKFSDVNYIDRREGKGSDGSIMYTVVVYIGNGKRSVEVTSFSKEQADEVESLMRGMLKCGALTHPEGDEEPFSFDDDKDGGFKFIKRRKKENEDSGKSGEKQPDTEDKADEENPKDEKDEHRSEETDKNE